MIDGSGQRKGKRDGKIVKGEGVREDVRSGQRQVKRDGKIVDFEEVDDVRNG